MGRPPKNPNHPVTRLRQQISTPAETVTREILAARAGVSPFTIRDIESGVFKLTEAVAEKLMIATAVSVASLRNGDDPLKDIRGKVLNPESGTARGAFPLRPFEEVATIAMMNAALAAVAKKKSADTFHELFTAWLPKALKQISATKVMKETLNRNLGMFDPLYVPKPLRPTQPKMRRRWEEAQDELVKMVVEEMKGDPSQHFRVYQDILDSGRLRDRLSKKS